MHAKSSNEILKAATVSQFNSLEFPVYDNPLYFENPREKLAQINALKLTTAA